VRQESDHNEVDVYSDIFLLYVLKIREEDWRAAWMRVFHQERIFPPLFFPQFPSLVKLCAHKILEVPQNQQSQQMLAVCVGDIHSVECPKCNARMLLSTLPQKSRVGQLLPLCWLCSVEPVTTGVQIST